jgi:hypothetical protein
MSADAWTIGAAKIPAGGIATSGVLLVPGRSTFLRVAALRRAASAHHRFEVKAGDQ